MHRSHPTRPPRLPEQPPAAAATAVREERYRLLVEHSPEAIALHRDGVLLLANRAAAQLLGAADHGALVGREVLALVHADDRAAVGRRIADLAARPLGSVSTDHDPTEFRLVRDDGAVAEVEAISVTVLYDDAPAIQTVVRDVTARRAAERAARASGERLRLALAAASLSVWEWDVPGDRVRETSAETPAAAAGGRRVRLARQRESCFSDFIARVHPDDRPRIHAAVARAAAEGSDLEVEYRVQRRDGTLRWRYSRGNVITGEAGAPVFVMGVNMDVTERKQLEEQLAHQAFHDPLTGLANRVLFRDRVEHALARARRRASPPTVLFLDLDNFKAVNDSFGHAAGDTLLVEVAGRLTACLRAADSCARLGGDEFAVLLEDAPDGADLGAHAAHVAERLIAAFRTPIVVEGTELFVGVSIGIATAAADDTADVLLRNADLAMYRAKGAGKGCYEVFEPAMHAAVRRRLELEAELRRAVEEPARQLALQFQPIAALGSGTIVGVEALVRWRHPQRGLVAPAEFIDIAEETGLVVPLGRWVLDEACRQAAAWQRAQPAHRRPLLVSLNLSGRQLALPELPRDVEAALAASGLAPGSLMLEVTESTLVNHDRATLERLWALRRLGVRLAIDDFGTGYSSLGYLERFPVDVLKIDKTFVERVGTTDGESPLARAILGLGSALDMRVVAEGIETERQWARLRELGCELGQGYFIAPPLPPDETARLLATPVGLGV